MGRVTAAAAVTVLALCGCSEPERVPPPPEPVVERTSASVAETCAALYDPRRSPLAGVEVTLPFVTRGAAGTSAARAATTEVDVLLGVAEDHGPPVLGGPVGDLRRLYADARRGEPVRASEVRQVVSRMDAVCGTEAALGAGWAAWPN